ncbi:MAG TPA: DUF2027 domain-containing protein, partial [Bacteroidales bacterium]|nr:DUF2027 domain-containing protein [Bacteroidales bacterium]
MKFKVGDQVKFLNDSGGGIISEIVDQKLVKVRIEDGFDIPVLASELIRDGSTDIDSMDSSTAVNLPDQKIKVKKAAGDDVESILPENLPGNTVKNVLLGFIPVDEDHTGMSDIGVYLINDGDHAIGYHIGFQENVSWYFLGTGFLEPNTKLYIETFSQSQISKIKALHIQLLFIGKGKYKLQSPVEKFIGLDNIRFYKENAFKENSYFHEKALLVKVSDEMDKKYEQPSKEAIEKDMAEKKSVENQKPDMTSGVDGIVEVDLHIHEIVDDYSKLSPGEIIELQMNRFYNALEHGLNNKVSKMVLIH